MTEMWTENILEDYKEAFEISKFSVKEALKAMEVSMAVKKR